MFVKVRSIGGTTEWFLAPAAMIDTSLSGACDRVQVMASEDSLAKGGICFIFKITSFTTISFSGNVRDCDNA